MNTILWVQHSCTMFLLVHLIEGVGNVVHILGTWRYEFRVSEPKQTKNKNMSMLLFYSPCFHPFPLHYLLFVPIHKDDGVPVNHSFKILLCRSGGKFQVDEGWSIFSLATDRFTSGLLTNKTGISCPPCSSTSQTQ